HRRVDHGEETRRYIHAGHATHECGRYEAGKVANHAAAEGDHRGVSSTARREELIRERALRVAGLVRFAGGNGEHRCDLLTECAADLGRVERADVAVGDDRIAMRARDVPHQL